MRIYAELPVSLRERFQKVFIQKNPDTGDDEVVFAISRGMGIICGSRKDVHDFVEYSLGEGVDAYWLQRE